MATTPHGWYPDSNRPGFDRFWNGKRWTDNLRPNAQATPEALAAYAAEQAAARSRGRKIGLWVGGSVAALIALVVVLSVAFAGQISEYVDSLPTEAPAPAVLEIPDAEPVDEDLGDGVTAWILCQDKMSELLKAPATAGYPLSNEFDIRQSGKTYDMDAWVDSENGFGANIRTYFSCRAKYQGNDEYLIRVTPLD